MNSVRTQQEYQRARHQLLGLTNLGVVLAQCGRLANLARRQYHRRPGQVLDQTGQENHGGNLQHHPLLLQENR